MARLGLTLAILKPSTVCRPHAVEKIVGLIKQERMYIIEREELLMGADRAALFYKEHEGKFFYNRLITYMTSGPLIAMALAGTEVIPRWRSLMGPTKVYKTQHESPGTIRGQHGISDTRNATHGSDSPQSALAELAFFFPQFNVDEWYSKHELHFRAGISIHFDEVKGVHYHQPG